VPGVLQQALDLLDAPTP